MPARELNGVRKLGTLSRTTHEAAGPTGSHGSAVAAGAGYHQSLHAAWLHLDQHHHRRHLHHRCCCLLHLRRCLTTSSVATEAPTPSTTPTSSATPSASTTSSTTSSTTPPAAPSTTLAPLDPTVAAFALCAPCLRALPSHNCCLLLLPLLLATAAAATGCCYCCPTCPRCSALPYPAWPLPALHCCWPLPLLLLAAATTALLARTAQRCPTLPGRRQRCRASATTAGHCHCCYWPLPLLPCLHALLSTALPCLAAAIDALLSATANAATGCCHCCCRALPLLLLTAATAALPARTGQRCPALPGRRQCCPAHCPALQLREWAPSLLLLAATDCHGHYHCPTSAAAKCAGVSLAAAASRHHEWAVRWGATTGGTCEYTPAGSAASRREGSGGGQQQQQQCPLETLSLQQQRPLGTLSPQQLHEWAVRWGSPGGGGFRGASRCFFRNCTTVTLLTAPVPITLADPSKGPVVARGATVLPCPAAPSGLLTSLHLPSFAKNFVATSVLQDQSVTVTQPRGELVAISTDSRTGEHLATFTRRHGSDLYTLTTESSRVAESGQVATSVEVAGSCLCRLLTHQTLLWHHCLGHPSLPRLHGMHSCLLVSGLPRSLPPLPRLLAPPCLPCVEGRQRTAPHSSFPPTTAPLQTLHMDVWGPARSKEEVHGVLIRWIHVVRRQIRAQFQQDLPVLRLHFDRGGEFSSSLLEDFSGAEGICQTFTLPASPQNNGIAERRIGLVMEVARTSIVHAVAPHFLWSFAVRYAVEQLNLWPRVSHPETSPTLRWTGEVGDASPFGSVCFYRLHPHRSSPVPLLPLALVSDPPPVAPLPPHGPAPSGAGAGGPGLSRQEALSPERLREWAVQWGSLGGGASRVRTSRAGGAGTTGATGGTQGIAAVGAAVGSPGSRRQEPLSPEWLYEWAVRWGSPSGGAGRAGAAGFGGAGPGGASAGVPGVGCVGGTGIGGTGAAGGSRGAGPRGASAGVTGVGRAGGTGTRGTGDVGGTGGAGGAATGGGAGGSAGATTQRQQFALRHLLTLLPAATEFPVAGSAHPLLFPPTLQSHPQLLPGSPLPAPSPHTALKESFTQRREPASRPVTPVRSHRVVRPCPPHVPGTHIMALRPSSVPQRVVLPSPPLSSLPHVPDPKSDLVRTASPTVTRLLATVVTGPSFESATASALVAELVDFAALCRLDHAFELECLAAASPHLASKLLCPEAEPDSLDIPTPRSYADAITVPPPGANIVDGMWIFRVKRPPDSLPAFKARYGSLHKAIWLRRPRGFTGSFPEGTQWSLRQPAYGLRQAPHLVKAELHERHTCTDLGPSALRLLVLLATVHSSVYRPLALSSTFERVPSWLATWLPVDTKSCEAEIYARAMASLELRGLTYLLADLGEQPCSPPFPYVDNNDMIVLCQDQRLEHRMKHIALRYYLKRELQQRSQLRLAYVATQANTADVFTKALEYSDHQHFCTALGLVPTLPHLLVS
ncbi:unnamed protein product [Closterium sp. NIES-53]